MKNFYQEVKNLDQEVRNLYQEVKNLHQEKKNLHPEVKNLYQEVMNLRQEVNHIPRLSTSFLDNFQPVIYSHLENRQGFFFSPCQDHTLYNITMSQNVLEGLYSEVSVHVTGDGA